MVGHANNILLVFENVFTATDEALMSGIFPVFASKRAFDHNLDLEKDGF